MRMGKVAVVTAAACMLSIPAFAQSNKTPSSKAQKQSMTLTGCLVGEADYRKAHNEGKSYFNNADLNDEFVLIEGSGSCTASADGKAYRMTGKREKELKPFVGHRIEITGSFEEKRDAQIAAGEKNAKLPPEVVVASFREAPSAVAAASAPAPAPAPAAAPEPAPSPAPVATEARNETPSREALPKTASNLPLVGIIGLFSLTAAFGLGFARRRAS